MENPVLRHDRTVGTHVESGGREREDRYKRRRRQGGKSPCQSRGVKWSESKVAKPAGHVPGKAAMAHGVPVP